MPIKLSDILGSMDEALNNQKIEEVFNKTKDVAENVSKKSAQRLDISKKRVECLDAKAKLNKYYEKFGELQYRKYIGDDVSDEEITDCANAIADNRQKVEFFTREIEKAKAAFNESVSNMAKKTRDAFSQDTAANEVQSDAHEVESSNQSADKAD